MAGSAFRYVDPRGTAYDPFNYDTATPADIAAANKAGVRDAAIAGGIGALGTVAQLGLTYAPTMQDEENKKRLAALAKRKGLSQAERAEIDEQAMRSVRTLAAESQNRDEAALAAGGQTSAAALSRARRDNARSLNEAAIQAADIGIRENRAQVLRDRQEEQERIAYEGGRERQRIELIGQTIAGLGQAVAPVLAANPVASMPTEAQMLAMQRARGPNGEPIYPGLQGMSLNEMRDAWRSEYKASAPNRPDRAPYP